MFLRQFLRVLLVVVCLSASAFGADGVVSGTIRTPSAAVVLGNANLTFQLNQASVIAGSAVIAPTQVTCSTSVNGSIVGVKNPVTAPSVSVSTASGSLAAGTYYVRYVYTGASSTVTLVSPVRAAVLASPGTITVTAPAAPHAGVGYKVYIGTVQGTEYFQGGVTGFASNFAQSTALSTSVLASGTNNTTCALAFNDTMIPTSTKYRVNLTDSNGGQVPGYPQFVYLQGTSVDVSNGWPTARDVETRYFTPIISSPSSNATQSINSPLTLNGYSLTTGASIFPQNASPPVCAAGTGYIFNVGGTLTICADTLNLSPRSDSKVRKCDSFAGADASIKIVACIADLPSTGGTADARGLEGGTWSACPVSGLTKPVDLVVGAGTSALAVDCTWPASVRLVSGKGSIISVASTKTLTINGPALAGLYQIFAGAGVVTFGGATNSSASPAVSEVYPQWWGAKADGGTTDDLAAVTSALAAHKFVKLVGNYGVSACVVMNNRNTISGGFAGSSQSWPALTTRVGFSGNCLLSAKVSGYATISGVNLNIVNVNNAAFIALDIAGQSETSAFNNISFYAQDSTVSKWMKINGVGPFEVYNINAIYPSGTVVTNDEPLDFFVTSGFILHDINYFATNSPKQIKIVCALYCDLRGLQIESHPTVAALPSMTLGCYNGCSLRDSNFITSVTASLKAIQLEVNIDNGNVQGYLLENVGFTAANAGTWTSNFITLRNMKTATERSWGIADLKITTTTPAAYRLVRFAPDQTLFSGTDISLGPNHWTDTHLRFNVVTTGTFTVPFPKQMEIVDSTAADMSMRIVARRNGALTANEGWFWLRFVSSAGTTVMEQSPVVAAPGFSVAYTSPNTYVTVTNTDADTLNEIIVTTETSSYKTFPQ